VCAHGRTEPRTSKRILLTTRSTALLGDPRLFLFRRSARGRRLACARKPGRPARRLETMQTISLKLPDDLLAQIETEAKARASRNRRSCRRAWRGDGDRQLCRSPQRKPIEVRNLEGRRSCDRPSQIRSTNSATVIPAARIRDRRVPGASSRCCGIDRLAACPGLIRMTWLPCWRSLIQPALANARTARAPETEGSAATKREPRPPERRWSRACRWPPESSGNR
jgi:hypothetical protein